VKRAPGPFNFPVLGVAARLQKDPLGYLTHLAREYGDIVAFRILDRRAFLLSHPDHIGEVLVTRQHNFGKSPAIQRMKQLMGEGLITAGADIHKRHRRLLQPAFGRERMPAYCAGMSRHAVRACEQLEAGATVEMDDAMMRLTLKITAGMLFGAGAESAAEEVGRGMTRLERAFRPELLPGAGLMRRLTGERRRGEKDLARVRGMVDGLIQQHRRAPGGRGDLLSAMLAARYDDGSAFSGEELRDEIMTLFAAGHSSSALALSWTWFLLAQNPECEAKLHEEVDSVLDGRAPGFEDLARLPYTGKVVSEALRLYPPVWTMRRMALESFELDGVEIPRGALCMMSPYVVQRDPRWFAQPDRFQPERWGRDESPKLAYFPFGAGARVCIGDRMAQAEIALVVATWARQWRFRLTNAAAVRPSARILLRPEGLHMEVVRR
jgi:cytochrome P450